MFNLNNADMSSVLEGTSPRSKVTYTHRLTLSRDKGSAVLVDA